MAEQTSDRDAFRAFAATGSTGGYALTPDQGISDVVVKLRDMHPDGPLATPGWDDDPDPLEQQIADEMESAMLDAMIGVARRYGWQPGVAASV